MLDIETLHGIIDDTQNANPGVDFSIKIVDEAQVPTKHLNVKEVYVNVDTKSVYFVFNSAVKFARDDD